MFISKRLCCLMILCLDCVRGRGHSPGPLLPQAFSFRVPGGFTHPGPVSLYLVLGYTSSPQNPLIKFTDTSKA